MARSSQVEYNHVAEACYGLFQRGEPISFQRVYDAIGNKGSSRVVNDYIKQWRQEAGDKLAISHARNLPGLPDRLVEAADTLLVQLWQGALNQSEETYQQARSELEQERQQIAELLQAERRRADAAERRQAELAAELAGMRSTVEARDTALAELNSRNRELQSALSATQDQVAALRADLARAMATLESERQRHDQGMTAAQEASAAEIRRVQERAESDRRHLLSQTDEIRQAARATADSLRDQFAGAKAVAETYQQQTYKAREEAALWRGRTEAAQEELTRLRSEISEIQADRARLLERIEKGLGSSAAE